MLLMTDFNRIVSSFLPFLCLPTSLPPCVIGRQSPVVTRQEPAAAPASASPPPTTPATDAPQDESMGITAFALFDYQAADTDEISFDPDDILTNIEMAGGVAGAMASTDCFQPIMSSCTAPRSEISRSGGLKVTPDTDDTQPNGLDAPDHHSAGLAQLTADITEHQCQLPGRLSLLLQLLR
ncbi:Src substrate cortactin [Portunus trituberculatus]|uniref:Src substrate cortactin n=1 Tax=Portunus trituberculatus TaxID=210409 RepID=A0A5B7CW25_PORTR|nr:Src substrate cortactin [Portunus trituberculatus]